MKKQTVILGGGLTGLSVAYHLGDNSIVLEKSSRVGGLCKSEKINGWTFDYTGHLLHFRNEYAKKLVFKLLNGNLKKNIRRAYIYTFDRYIPYPFQANLYSLPSLIQKECVQGMLDTKLHLKNPKNLEEWIISTFGKGIAKYFMIPYNQKMWKTPLKNMNPYALSKYAPVLSIDDIMKSIVENKPGKFGYNVNFWYPKSGGIEEFVQEIAKKIKNVCLNSEITGISLKNRYVVVNNTKKINFDTLVSTLPITELISKIDEVPDVVRKSAQMLEYVSVLNINIGVARDNISDKHWVYFSEKKFVFYRIGFYTNISRALAPKGTTSMYIEVAYRNNIDKNAVFKRVKEDLFLAKVLNKSDKILAYLPLDIKYAYPVNTVSTPKNLAIINRFLNKNSVYSIGRFGKWHHSSMEDAILEGKCVLSHI
ncbi:MAG: FAD-dependent oxidoreductase [Candidatus Firestonebacteria bacterium]